MNSGCTNPSPSFGVISLRRTALGHECVARVRDAAVGHHRAHEKDPRVPLLPILQLERIDVNNS